jgi:hypothetical protein
MNIKGWSIGEVCQTIIDEAEDHEKIKSILKQLKVSKKEIENSFYYKFENKSDSDILDVSFIEELGIAELFENRIRMQKLEKIV